MSPKVVLNGLKVSWSLQQLLRPGQYHLLPPPSLLSILHWTSESETREMHAESRPCPVIWKQPFLKNVPWPWHAPQMGYGCADILALKSASWRGRQCPGQVESTGWSRTAQAFWPLLAVWPGRHHPDSPPLSLPSSLLCFSSQLSIELLKTFIQRKSHRTAKHKSLITKLMAIIEKPPWNREA